MGSGLTMTRSRAAVTLRRMTTPHDTYTRGHDDSVLGSHRWRTAESSAGHPPAHLPDGASDVVHAHQVLQHVSDTVMMLWELRRVRAADGVVAVRDADDATFTWYPQDPVLVHGEVQCRG